MFGSTRRASRAPELALAGVHPLVGEPATLGLGDVPHGFGVVYSVPPPQPAAEVNLAVTRLASAGARRVAYLSATSVYGVDDGRWVDDATPAEPLTESGHRRLEHEQSVAEACGAVGLEFVSVRLPGIYGPWRTIAQRVRSGTYAVVDGGSMFTNRIFVDDIGPAVLMALEHAPAGTRLIASDAAPFRVIEMATWVCARLNAAPPRTIALDEAPQQTRDFWRGSRRCHPSTLLGLGWRPSVVDWREGHLRAWETEGREG